MIDAESVRGGVEKCFRSDVRIRIDTLLQERGIKWADVYNKLKWNKSFASHVHKEYIPHRKRTTHKIVRYIVLEKS